MIRRVAYADGAPYRPPRAMAAEGLSPRTCNVILDLPKIPDWPDLWRLVRTHLAQLGFRTGTLLVYRQVLRSFRTFATCHALGSGAVPAAAGRHLRPFIDALVDQKTSASWLSLNICILRTVFDKLAGHTFTRHLRSPRKPIQLPDILAESELTRLIRATPTPRDRLLIGFLYGCGLKVGEACNLRWRDLDPQDGFLHVVHAVSGLSRTLPIPDELRPLLEKGKSLCAPDDCVFPGGRRNAHLSARTVERMLRKAAEEAKLTKVVTCMTLRHSHAVHRLRAGDDIRTVQQDLGHLHVETTMAYQALIHSAATVEAVNRLTAGINIDPTSPQPTPSPAPPASPAPRTMPFSLPPSEVIFPFADIAFDWRSFLAGLRTRLTTRFFNSRSRACPERSRRTGPE